MKKRISILLVIALCLSLFALTGCGKKDDVVILQEEPEQSEPAEPAVKDAEEPVQKAEEKTEQPELPEENEAIVKEPVNVFVTLAGAGELACAWQSVAVTDFDGDGAITVSDAIACAHNEVYEGGAEAGYVCEESDWGLSVYKLLGIENGGSYGCYINNEMVMAYDQTVSEGDFVYAFSFADLTAWSDCYAYFDKNTVSGETFTLTLTALCYDESWNVVPTPVSGAVISVAGTETEFVTGEDGTVEITVDLTTPGLFDYPCVISAKTDAMTLVPPVCLLTAE